jgi:hypothetical protein
VLVVDFTRMQRHMRTLCERAQTPSTFQRRREGYTCDEALFYSGTDGLKASALQKFGYNKATFSESDLPGHSAGGKDDGATDGSLRQSFGDAKAEASEFEDEDLDDSALDSNDNDEHDSTDNDEYDDNAFDDRMVIDHHDRDRTSQFTQQVEVQSTESPTKISHAALLEDARQFVDNAAELRDHARPIATNRIPGAGARADRPLSTINAYQYKMRVHRLWCGPKLWLLATRPREELMQIMNVLRKTSNPSTLLLTPERENAALLKTDLLRNPARNLFGAQTVPLLPTRMDILFSSPRCTTLQLRIL